MLLNGSAEVLLLYPLVLLLPELCTGKGMIHGNSCSPEFVTAEYGRNKPLGIRMISCDHILVQDITLKSARLWFVSMV